MNSAVFNLGELRSQHDRHDKSWLEFLKVPSLSMGVYRVVAGANDQDTHAPHDRDEVYVTISGRGKLTVEGEAVDVAPDSIVFVKAGVDHFFHDVSEDLSLLVFFSAPQSGVQDD